MLRHPFHGVTGSAEELVEQQATTYEPAACEATDRRRFFGQVLASLAGLGVWVMARVAAAQAPWNVGGGTGFPAWGPLQGGYGGAVRPPANSGGTVTTFALGEEGAARPPRRRWSRGRVTTLAFGEEGGVTTYALGEEGGGVTTYALGEEGGYYRRR